MIPNNRFLTPSQYAWFRTGVRTKQLLTAQQRAWFIDQYVEAASEIDPDLNEYQLSQELASLSDSDLITECEAQMPDILSDFEIEHEIRIMESRL